VLWVILGGGKADRISAMNHKTLKILVSFFMCISMAFSAQDKPIDPQCKDVHIDDDSKETGPTVYLGFDSDKPKENSVEDFMYFVPLIAPVDVETDISLNNNQKTRIVSCKRETKGDEFEAECEFTMLGTGHFENKFDPEQIIEKSQEDFKVGKPLKNIIEYINFKGQGKGRVHIKGEIKDGIEHVSSVKVVFNAGKNQSPVTVGLYTVPYENSQYKYENKEGELIARVNSLTFKSDQEEPRMDLELAAISKPGKKEGFCSRLKGCLANLLVKPLKVDPLGNEVMLDFGHALYSKHASFTFPKAEKLKTKITDDEETVVAKADNKNISSKIDTD
jgi:hypothetical protein